MTAQKAGPNLSAWVVSIVISLTVLFSVSLGVVATYGVVNGILHLFVARTRSAEAQPIRLIKASAAAGARILAPEIK